MAGERKSFLTPTQRYGAGALFAFAVNQAQIHQTHPLGLPFDDHHSTGERTSSSSSNESVSDDPDLWVNERSGLLRPVFRFLDIDSAAWLGLEETAGTSRATNHVGAFMRLIAEQSEEGSSERLEQEIALSKAVDAMAFSMETNSESSQVKKEKSRKYEQEYREKYSTPEVPPNSVMKNQPIVTPPESDSNMLRGTDNHHLMCDSLNEKPTEEVGMLTYQRKVMVLYELLSACLAAADTREDSKKYTRRRKGYDARHRVALRLLTSWFDIEWIKMESIEMIVAFSAMALVKEKEAQEEESQSSGSTWAKWKRRGIIGAAAVAGGTLMAITGAAGAGLTGSKMARRTGNIDEFEFIAIGDYHNQGRLAVEILISGFVFSKEDYVRPWEGQIDNMERFVLLWESRNLIAVSTAIQDWLTSSIALELMRQGAMMTVLSSLVAALALPAVLLSATNFIDSKWSIAVDRSDKAGRLLAEVLLKGYQGNRPVTLIGYSLGARVIFSCLQALSETERNAELVERVVLLGAPIAIKDENWEAARKMVAGRFINAYSTKDWMLGVAFRASLLTNGLAGLQPVDVQGIENVDVTDTIEGHSSYLWSTRKILERLELEVCYPVFKSKEKEE
ncbi:Transmembrane and coiled-coil domain-containing 4 [Gossypium arboreum]|uniref:Transmembrane and coiled-coil domain-containing 4 n=1 Tax=Gossypium arboreum TaxID=29729 RepID=A0A0B0PGL4_GOSAR|nr:Transmembrane and coiled-coil domain-containing 4 [Gossypium arboreum]